MRWMIYHLVGHKILNKTLYIVKRYYFRGWRYLRKCTKKLNIIEWIKILLHKLRHEYAKHISNCNALLYIMIDVIWFIRNYILYAAVHCSSALGLLLYFSFVVYLLVLRWLGSMLIIITHHWLGVSNNYVCSNNDEKVTWWTHQPSCTVYTVLCIY